MLIKMYFRKIISNRARVLYPKKLGMGWLKIIFNENFSKRIQFDEYLGMGMGIGMGMGWVDIPKPIPIQDWSGWQTNYGEEQEAFQTE